MANFNFIGQLKEYIDKDPDACITYEVFPEASGFKATVKVPALRLRREEPLQCDGQICLSKKLAEQSAASKALNELGQIEINNTSPKVELEKHIEEAHPYKIKYETAMVQLNQFQTTLTLPVGHMRLTEVLQTTGNICSTKKQAEQSAAAETLKLLPQRPQYCSVECDHAFADMPTPDMSLASGDEESLSRESSETEVPPPPVSTCEVHRVLLTGGPCGAKSTAFRMLMKVLPDQFGVIVRKVEDLADMIDSDSMVEMNSSRLRQIQEEREDVAYKAAMQDAQTHRKSVVLLIDRGVVERSLDLIPPHASSKVLDRYDVIVHLMSPAIDKPEFYEKLQKEEKPSMEIAAEEDVQIRRCYQRHPKFHVLWNGQDKGQAIPVFLGWKLKQLLKVVTRACSLKSCSAVQSGSLDAVETWLRSKQLCEAFGCEGDAGIKEVCDPLAKLLRKHLNGNDEWVRQFFDHVRYVRPLDTIGFMETLPESLREYVESQMPGVVARGGSCSCAEKEQTSGKPGKVALELLAAYREAFKDEPPQVSSYLDIGSGTCTTASAVARDLGLRKEQVNCLDIEESCGQRAADVTFQLFDGEKLPLETASVDLITVVHVLHHVEPGGSSMFRLLLEARRVLKPGGIMIVKEHDSPNKNYDLYLEAMHSLKQLVFYTNEPEKMPLGSYQSVDQWRITLRRVGLPVIHVKPTGDIYNSVVMVLEKIDDGDQDNEA